MTEKVAYVIGDGGFAREVAVWATHAGWEVLGLVGRETQERLAAAAERLNRPFNCFLGLGKPAAKMAAVESLGPYARYPSLFSHQSGGARNASGHGCVLCPGVVLTTDVTLGNFVTVNLSCTVGHDAVLEDFCSLMPQVAVSGYCRIGRAAYLGVHSAVLEKLEVGAEAVLGGGALLTKNLPAGETWAGVPARRLK
jgi:sugar O-acyltransferase (sialic acid O-acetyltransferase NeuD family)